jgi:hypothetical protein
MPTLSIARIAAPIMRELVTRSGETVLVATLDQDAGSAVYVEKIESPRSIRYSVALGTSRPLYCSAAGRVLLAFADPAYISRYLKRAPFAPLTKQTLTRSADIRRLLPQIREQRLAITVGEVSSDVAGFAAPIFDREGRVIAALTMAAPVRRTLDDPEGGAPTPRILRRSFAKPPRAFRLAWAMPMRSCTRRCPSTPNRPPQPRRARPAARGPSRADGQAAAAHPSKRSSRSLASANSPSMSCTTWRTEVSSRMSATICPTG